MKDILTTTLAEKVHEAEGPLDLTRIANYHLGDDRKGYVMARFALAYAHDLDLFGSLASNAVTELNRANQAGQLQPPLETGLADALNVFEEDVTSGHRRAASQLTTLLLSMAVDNGSRIR